MARYMRGLLYGLAIVLLAQPALTQEAANPVEEANKGTVGIISGGVDGTYIRVASDLAKVLDDGDDLRILAIRGKGSVQNISDILYLRGVDIGIVQSDVLEFSQRDGLHHPRITDLISYVTKLYNEEVHVLGRRDIANLADLEGRRVNVGIEGSGTEMTASIIFDKLGISVEETSFDLALAIEKLKAGKIDGLVYVTGKPTRAFAELAPDDPVHFVPIEFNPDLIETYLPSRLTSADYPDLIPAGEEVDTLAVGAVMAVYNWNEESYRYRKVSRFINAFFDRFSEFQEAPRHPKWQEVSLSAEVPGWNRFAPAQEWLAGKEEERAFEAFLVEQKSTDIGSLSEEARAKLLEEFQLTRASNNQ